MLRVFIIIICLSPFTLWSQNSDNETRIFYVNQYLYKGEDANAISLLYEVIKSDSLHKYAYQKLAEVLYDHKKTEELCTLYEKASRLLGEEYPEFMIMYANTLFTLGRINESENEYNKSIKSYRLQPEYRAIADRMLEKCRVSEEIKSKPVPFNPVNLGNMINSELDEYLPSFSVDQSVMFITRKLVTGTDPVTGKENTNEDFFYCTKESSGNWAKAMPVTVLNTSDNEGAHCLSADGNTLVFTACNRCDTYGTCDLYISNKRNGYWTTPVNMGPVVNSSFWDSQPSLSSDGKTLYYASKRKGGKGGTDIWYSKLNNIGIWMQPVNLGDSVNTAENEISPFIHPDGITLYFASKGHPGVGNYDVFVSRFVNGTWRNPVNLGYPINTGKDEMSMIVNPSGNIAYFASVRDEGMGGQDIYHFELYPEARAGNVTWIKGHITDTVTGNPLSGKADLYHIQSGTLVYSGNADKDGNFLVCFHQNGDFAVNVSHKGYMIFSDHFSVSGDYTKTPFVKEVKMKQIVKGASMNLNNIFFDTDSYNLKPESYFELDKLLAFLKANTGIVVKIIGHTDNQGSAEHNVTLSKNRADVVMKYLSGKGIIANRMSCEGLGAGSPVAGNESEEGRALNRRTEIVITGIK